MTTQDIWPRFTEADANRAYDEWLANCGPGAIAAICGLTLDEIRPHLGDFERKKYMNPTMVFATLRSLGVRWAPLPTTPTSQVWPKHGLVRVQFEGPWLNPGVPMPARYGPTHWVGAHQDRADVGIFDINCMNNGSGWVSLKDWDAFVVPHLTAQHRRATGKWHQTHVLEMAQGSRAFSGRLEIHRP